MQRWGRDTVVPAPSSDLDREEPAREYDAAELAAAAPFDLSPGETLLWWGGPRPRSILNKDLVFKLLFLLVWVGFALFWSYTVAAAGGPALMILFGLGLGAFGAYGLVNSILDDRNASEELHYGVTDRRVIMRRDGRTTYERSLPIDQLPELTVIEKGEHGSIVFERYGTNRPPATTGFERAFDRLDNTIYGNTMTRHRRRTHTGPPPIVFRDIERVRDVARLIRDAIEARAKEA